MSKIAVIKTGGKQYKVKEGQALKVEKLNEEVGATVKFDALLVAEEDGKAVVVGKPVVENYAVEAKVVEHGKADKVSVIKYKNKTRYKRNVGHRQPFTKIEVVKL